MYFIFLCVHTNIWKGDKMDENIQLLEYMYKNSEMCVYTLNKLLEDLKDRENKIKKLIDEEIKHYQNYLNECKKIIKKNKYNLKENSLMTKMSSSMGIKKEVKKDNSDAAIAHMLTEGITMGIVDMETKIKNYKDSVDKNIYELANDYLKYHQSEIEKLKTFM
jgi:alanyl-tRNA synthetase